MNVLESQACTRLCATFLSENAAISFVQVPNDVLEEEEQGGSCVKKKRKYRPGASCELLDRLHRTLSANHEA